MSATRPRRTPAEWLDGKNFSAVAGKMKVHRSTVTRIANGTVKMSGETLLAFADALSIDPAQIILGDEDSKADEQAGHPAPAGAAA